MSRTQVPLQTTCLPRTGSFPTLHRSALVLVPHPTKADHPAPWSQSIQSKPH